MGGHCARSNSRFELVVTATPREGLVFAQNDKGRLRVRAEMPGSWDVTVFRGDTKTQLKITANRRPARGAKVLNLVPTTISAEVSGQAGACSTMVA